MTLAIILAEHLFGEAIQRIAEITYVACSDLMASVQHLADPGGFLPYWHHDYRAFPWELFTLGVCAIIIAAIASRDSNFHPGTTCA